ncbi:MAG TPA: SDR family NAD(P)-dependent oxidoreductase [Opitutaceae bacterium]|nr:SDR family NAD(P)-dependent oxidoreductase [Opitutaceae bacterium]
MTSPRAALLSYSAVIVTGGSSGIGKSFIALAGKLNRDLIFCNLSRRAPDKNSSEISELKLNHFACDLAQPAEIERGAAAVRDFLGRTVPSGKILLINNSGFGTYGRFPEPNLARQLEMIDVNARAVLHLTGLLLPLLRARGGAVVTVASTAAFQPTPYLATYGATKAFVLHWSHALNAELRGSGVRALAVCPGPTATAFFRAAGLEPGNHAESTGMSSEAVAAATFRALASGRAEVVPGLRNRLVAFSGGLVSKTFATRVARVVIGRHRLQHVAK